MADDTDAAARPEGPQAVGAPETVAPQPSKPNAIAEHGKALADRTQLAAREAWTDFRRNSVYFQLKAGLVVAYVAIVLLTLLIAPPAPPTFALTVGSVPWGVGKRTYVDLDNLELGTLKDVVVEVHGRVVEFDGKESRGPWSMRLPRLTEGDTVRLWPEKLMTAENRPAGDNLDVSRVRVFAADDPSDVFVDGVPKRKSD